MEGDMKSLYFLLTLMISNMWNPALYAQNTDFFEYPKPQTVTLTEQQQEIRQSAELREYAKSTVIVRVNQPQALKQQSAVMLNLPNGIKIPVQQKNLRIRDEQRFTWNGATDGTALTTQFAVTEKGITGWIRSAEYYFMLSPLGNGMHLLTEVDPEKFPQERAPLRTGDKEGNGESSPKNKAGLMSNPEIDVLVVYTSQASSQSGDIAAVINGAEDVTNSSFGNSIVPAGINVVHTAQISYSESGDILDDLCRLTGSSTFTPSGCSGVSNLSAMDNVHSLRDQYGADLVVLLGRVNTKCCIFGYEFIQRTI
jgi:hypothetical protein